MEVEYKDPPFELSFEARLREVIVALRENTEAVRELTAVINRVLLESNTWPK